jgi:hypothetical protein
MQSTNVIIEDNKIKIILIRINLEFSFFSDQVLFCYFFNFSLSNIKAIVTNINVI